jgi:hypothetical protein
MALNGTLLIERETANAGAQVAGDAEVYQKSGTVGISANIHPYDSGTILGTVPPGKPGIKLVDGTIQSATKLVCNNGPLGNTLTSSNQPTALGDPIVNPAQVASAGLSLAPQTE